MPLADPVALREALTLAENDGYRLEVVDGLGIWEAQPGLLHVRKSKAVTRSIRPDPQNDTGCGCVVYEDLYVSFPGGSLRRPDIAVFCSEPPESDGATALVPAAVVEIVSRGSEGKDYELNPPFYLRHGVGDVLVVDPYVGAYVHHTAGGTERGVLPNRVALRCGCLLDV